MDVASQDSPKEQSIPAAKVKAGARTKAKAKVSVRAAAKAAAKELEKELIAAYDAPGAKYGTMYYSVNGTTRKTHSVAIREKFGKKCQLMQLSCKILDRQQLEKLALECVEKIHAGTAVSEVKIWANEQKLARLANLPAS